MFFKNKNITIFLKGFLSAFNLRGEHIFIEYSKKSPYEIDFEAILSDWNAVGNDIKDSIISLTNTTIQSNTLKTDDIEKLRTYLTKILNEQKKEKQKEGFVQSSGDKPRCKPAIAN